MDRDEFDDGPCGCDRGWVFVDGEYAARQWPVPPPLALDATERGAAEHEARTLAALGQQALYADAVIPCERCAPVQYARWAEGAYRPKSGAGLEWRADK